MDEYRKEIDKIDEQILGLLGRRFELSRQIGRYKREHGMATLDAGRERQVQQRLAKLAADQRLEPAFCTAVYDLVFEYSRAAQR